MGASAVAGQQARQLSAQPLGGASELTKMRKVTCPHCNRTFSEADASWDIAASTGACPSCGKLLDVSAEAAAAAAASVDPQIRRSAQRARIGALGIGLGFVGVGVFVLFAAHTLWIWPFALALPSLGFSLFYNPRAAARNQLKARTDLSSHSRNR